MKRGKEEEVSGLIYGNFTINHVVNAIMSLHMYYVNDGVDATDVPRGYSLSFRCSTYRCSERDESVSEHRDFSIVAVIHRGWCRGCNAEPCIA